MFPLAEPNVVTGLNVTAITTSSISLSWIKPLENSSFYKVQWTDGIINKISYESETKTNLSDLTAGVQYNISVTAVAGDNQTEGQSSNIFLYTSKYSFWFIQSCG